MPIVFPTKYALPVESTAMLVPAVAGGNPVAGTAPKYVEYTNAVPVEFSFSTYPL
jgi:hypothetical protein